MLRVVHSNDPLLLQAAWQAALPATLSPFPDDAHTVIVADRLIGHWLTKQVALTRGVCVGLTFVGFEQFVASAFAGAQAMPQSRRELSLALANALANMSADDGVGGGPLATYMARLQGNAEQMRVQLAERLAGQIWDYAKTRPDWLLQWMARDHGGAGPGTTSQAAPWHWQAELFCHAFDGCRVPTPVLGLRAAALGMPRQAATAIDVFGFGHLDAAQLQTLRLLASERPVTVWALNPCQEFWFSDAQQDALPLALRWWARPTRDTMAALVDIANGDAQEVFADEPVLPHHVLARLKADVAGAVSPPGPTPDPTLAPTLATRTPGARPDTAEIAADFEGQLATDITVFACPSIRRELEVVAQQITEELAADPSLHASEIAVLAAGADAHRYLLGVPFAFERAGKLRSHVVSAPIDRNGGAPDALLAILALVGSRFTRADMLRVMTHPFVVGGFASEASDWIAWTERLGIAHGRGLVDQAGTYLAAVPYFGWDYGIKRMALGSFASGLRSERGPIFVGNQPIAPFELTSDEVSDAATFALLARSLIADATWLANLRSSLGDWLARTELLIAAYLRPVEPTAQRAVANLLATIRSYRDLTAPRREMSVVEFREWLTRWLAFATGDRGDLLVDGVTVMPLGQVSSLAFRQVYIVGLGESKFPAFGQKHALDLRDDHRAGDQSPRDRDRLQFWHALGSCREKLFCSYLANDETSGEALGPSTVLLELAEMLAPYLGQATPAAALANISRPVPLFGFRSPSGALADGQDGLRWASATRAALRAHVAQHGLLVPTEDELSLALPLVNPTLAAAFGLPMPATATASEVQRVVDVASQAGSPRRVGAAHLRADNVRTLSFATLRKFLEAPVQAWAIAVLEMAARDDDDDDAIMARVNEPFGFDPLSRATVLRGAMELALFEPGQTTESAYDQLVAAAVLQGAAPVAVFGEAARHAHLAQLARWRNALGLLAVSADGATSVRRIAFGTSYGQRASVLPPLELNVELPGGVQRFRLVGSTDLIVPAHGSVVFRAGTVNESHLLRGFFDHAMLSLGWPEHGAHKATVFGAEGEPTVTEFKAWPKADVATYLGSLIAELFSRDHAYVMPFSRLKAGLLGKPPSLRRTGGDPRMIVGYGPIPDATGLRTDDMINAQAGQMAASRLGPLLDIVKGDDPFGISR